MAANLTSARPNLNHVKLCKYKWIVLKNCSNYKQHSVIINKTFGYKNNNMFFLFIQFILSISKKALGIWYVIWYYIFILIVHCTYVSHKASDSCGWVRSHTPTHNINRMENLLFVVQFGWGTLIWPQILLFDRFIVPYFWYQTTSSSVSNFLWKRKKPQTLKP